MSEQVTITVPKALAEQFLKMAEQCSDQMGNAGCNDWEMPNTQEYRDLIDLAQASNCHMTLEEYRASDEYSDHHVYHEGTKRECLMTTDFIIFDLFVNKVKEAVGE